MVMKMDSRLNMDTLNQDILNQDSSSLATLASGDVVLLPSADFVTDAALVRHNDDLILTLPDGREFVVEGYFAVDPRPTLSVGEGDMALTPELVSSFLQDIRFEGEGSATAVDGQGTAIGNAETVIGDAFIVRDGERIALEAGEPVFQGDIVETETGGSVKLRFVDETVFSISEDARLALDKMVFDPATSEGESLFSMLKGGFLFISGQIAKTDPSDMQVVTPVATIGIRGTIVTGSVNPGEAFEFSVIDGAIAVQPQGADAPIVMSDAFATLGGTVSETGAISVATRQSSAQEVVERNAGQFATLSDADVSVIESAVLASATENGAAIVLDLQEIVSSVVSQANESGSEASGDSDEEPAVIVELEPVAEPEPEPVVLEAQTTVEVLETGLTDSDSGDDSADDDIGTTVIEEDPGDTEAPAAPVITTSDENTLGRDVAILSGTAEPGSTVTVVGELDGDTGTTDTVTTTAAADGSWSVDLGEDEGFAADGETYSYTVTATDAAGNVSEPASIDLTLKFTELAAPTLNDPGLTDGYIGTGGYFVLSGTSPDTDTVTVTLTGDGDPVVYEDVPVNNEDWSLDLSGVTPTSGTLDTATGDYQVTVTAADGIGNSAESDPVAIKIDHLDPVLSINEPADTLNIENSTISGTADTDQVTVTLKDTNNNNEIVYKVDVGDDGTWELDLESAESDSGSHHFLADGSATYSVSVSATDGGGNTSSKSATNSFSADFEAPSVTLDTLPSNGQNTIIEGTSTDPDPVTVTLTGDNNTSVIYTVTPTGDATNGYTWTLDLETATPTSGTLADDGTVTYDIFVTTEDSAENASNIAIANDVTTDFTAPVVTIDQNTNDLLGIDEKMITGTADTDEVTVTITDPNNSNSSYEQTVEVDKDTGTWELNLELFGLDEGTAYDIEVKATDGAGNSTTEKITGVTTDFTAPDVTVELQGDDNLLGSAESTIMGTATEVDTVTVKIMDGDTVVYENDAVSVDASSNNGAWSLDLTTAGLDDSGGTTYDIEVTATDDAGNSTTEEITDVTIDLVDPEVETAQTDGTAFNDDNHKISGTSTDAETIEVTITETTQGSSFSHTEKVTVNDDGTWELDLKTVPKLDVGGTATYDITVTATDAAGNQTTDTTTGVTAHFLDPIVTIEGVGNDGSILASGTEIGGTLTNFEVDINGPGTGTQTVTVTFTNSDNSNDIITYNATIQDDGSGNYTWVLDLKNEDPIDAESTGTLVTDGTATYDITINATDDEGDKATALTITDVTTDFDVPVVTLDTLTSSDLASSTSEISGTSTDPDPVTVTLTGDDNTTVEYEVTPQEDPVNGGYTWTLDLETATSTSGTLDTTGNTTYSIKVTTEDAAGNPSDPDATDANATTVTTDFEAPEVTIDQQDNATLANSDTTTSDDTTITGTATGTDKVTVTIKDQAGNTVYEAVDLDATGGTWALDLSGITELDQSGGTAYDITVTASDTVGNQATQAQITGVTTDFEAPTVGIVYANDYAIAAHDPLGGDVSGADTVTVVLDDGNGTTFTYNDVPIDHNTNTWSLDLTTATPTSTNPTGATLDTTGGTPYDITVTAKDAAGNEASVERTGITTDFVDPTVGFSALADGTTALADNAVLNTNDMTLNGTSDGAASITVTLTYTDAQQTQQEIIYTSTNGDVTLNQDGTWSVDLASNTELDLTGETDYTITATATDAAGNTADTTISGVNTDFTPPTVGFSALADSTTLADDAVLNTNDTTLNGTSDGAASITVTLTYMDGQQTQQEITYTNITPEQDGTWSVDLTSDATLDLTGATDYTITATATDAAGNTADTTITGVNTDFTAPSVGIHQQGSITLANSDTTTTDDTTITGTADTNEVTVTLTNGTTTFTYDNVSVSNGTWSLDLNSISPTSTEPANATLDTAGGTAYSVTATAKDDAGNITNSTETISVTTDFEGPEVTLDTTALDSTSGTATATGALGTISGTATGVGAHQTVTVTLSAGGTAVTYTVAVNGDAWTLDLNTAIPDNGTEPLNVDIATDYTLSVTATDALGNSGASTDQVITINQSASIAYTELGDGDGDLDNTTPTISGTVEPGSTVSIIIYDKDGNESQKWDNVTVDGSGNFSQTASALTVGEDYRIEIKTTDPAGNTNDVSETVTVTLPKTTLDGSTSTDFSTSATGVYVVDSAADENIILTGADDEVLLTGGGTDTVNAGDGDDLIRIGEAGVVTPDNSEATVDAGAGENTIEIENSSGYFSEINITGGDGDDTVTGTSNGTSVADISTGAGNDKIDVANIDGTIDGGDGTNDIDVTTDNGSYDDLVISGGADHDDINFKAEGSTLTSVTINAGDADGDYNVVDFSSTGGTIGKIEINGGADEDVITVTSDETGTATSTTSSDVTIDAKDGTNTVTLNNKTGNYSNVNITGGSGSDSITAISAAAATVNIEAGAGDDTLYLTDVSGAVNAGEGDDTIIFDEVSAGLANLALDAGDGDDTVEISHGDFVDLAAGSNNTLSGGNGTDELVITGIASGAAVDASFATGFESIKLMAANSTGSSLSLGLDNTQSLVTPSMTGSADTLVLDGAISGINSITASDGITATIQNSDNAGTGLTVDDITVGDNSHLTLEADAQVTGYGNYDYSVTDLNIGENASLTLQSDKSDANNGSATDNGTSYLLDVNGTFAMTESSTLNVDLLNLSGNDLINATTVLDLGNTSSADLAGTLNIYANDGIDDTGASSSQLIANTSGAGGISSTFDEILFLDANGNNLVGTDVENGSDQALIPLYDQYSGLTLNAVSAEEISGGSTYTTNGQADAAFFSNDGTALRTEEANVSLFGSNDQNDTFEVAGSATSIGYYDGGEGGNDTLKLSGDQAIAFHDQYSATGIMDYQVNRIETLDISTSTGYSASSQLSLSSAMVKAMTENTNAVLADQLITAANALILKVGQGGSDKVDLSQWGTPGSASGNGTNYTVYEKDGAKLYIDES